MAFRSHLQIQLVTSAHALTAVEDGGGHTGAPRAVLSRFVRVFTGLAIFKTCLKHQNWVSKAGAILSASQIGLLSPFCWGDHSSSFLRHQDILGEAQGPSVSNKTIKGKWSLGDLNTFIFKEH